MDKISETGAPESGFVEAVVTSSFDVDDTDVGISLPRGLQVQVRDGEQAPISDAQVRVYPGGFDPIDLEHKGGGWYSQDVLSGRIEPPESEYFFEVVSTQLVPERVVLRVPHEALITRPVIDLPTPNTDHTDSQPLSVVWQPVEGADCYDVGVLINNLMGQEPTWITEECIEETNFAIDAEALEEYIRVRARRTLGDEDPTIERYHSESTSESDVRIYLVPEV